MANVFGDRCAICSDHATVEPIALDVHRQLGVGGVGGRRKRDPSALRRPRLRHNGAATAIQRDARTGNRRMLSVGQVIVVQHGDRNAAQIACARDLDSQIAQINHRLGKHALDSRPLRLERRVRLELDALRRHPVVGSDDEQRGFEQTARAKQLEHRADSFVGAMERLAQPLVMGAVVVAGAIGDHELVRDEHRSAAVAMFEEVDRLRHAADVHELFASHRGHIVGLPSRTYFAEHLGGERFEARLVADDPPLEHRMIGAASLRLMDRSRDRARATGALEGLVERLDAGIQKTLSLENVALNRHGLAMFAQVESGIDNVVMPAPCAGQNRRVAGPRDAREIDDRSVREHRATLDEAGEVWNRARIVIELMAQFRMRQAVKQEHVSIGWTRGVVVDNFLERIAVLALEVNLGG